MHTRLRAAGAVVAFAVVLLACRGEDSTGSATTADPPAPIVVDTTSAGPTIAPATTDPTSTRPTTTIAVTTTNEVSAPE